MKTVTTKQQAHAVAKSGVDCILVQECAREAATVINGFKRAFWFANYTSKGGKVGWTSQAKAVQIHVVAAH